MNKYGYVQGDPVNLTDPHGTNAYDGPIDGFCAAEFESCGAWDWYYGGGGGGDGDWSAGCGFGFGTVCGFIPGSCYVGIGNNFFDELALLSAPGCNTSDDQPVNDAESPWECPAQYQNWINTHGSDAASIASPISTTEANILALSAYESGWGGGNFVVNAGNAFFNLETTKPKKGPNPHPFKYSTGWRQAGLADKNGNYALVATYANYLDSAKSFAYYKGSLFTNVTDTTNFGTIASQHGFGISASTFVSIANVFVKCLQ